MSADLRSQCEKFVHGHVPQKPGEEFALIAEYCRENNFSQDYYGAGVLVNSFERKIADLLGFEAACFMPSGTMAQQIALKIYTGKTDRQTFAIHPTSHLELHEQHAYAHLSNLKSVLLGERNRQLAAKDIENANQPFGALIIELPARELGGQLPDWKELGAIKKAVKNRGAFLHMDGARLWETKPFYRKSYAEICRGFDSVYVSFYKGIGALTGAMLVGAAEFIDEARVWLRRFGGNLYQLHPYVASAARRFERALEQMPKYVQRAKDAYQMLKDIDGIFITPAPPPVNMFHLYFDSTVEKLTEARNKIAAEDRIWAANGFQRAALENFCYMEIHAGEGLLQIGDDQLKQIFEKLVRLAK